jgi:hypothetical protein
MKANYTLCISALLLAVAAIAIDVALFYDASEITFREVSYPLALAAVAEMLLFVYLLMKLQETAAKKRKQQFPVIAGIIAVIVLLVAYAALITLRVYAYANIPADTPASPKDYWNSLFMAVASVVVALWFLVRESKKTADLGQRA